MPLLRHRKLDKAAKNAYWLVVADCLVEFYDASPELAASLSQGRRFVLENGPKGTKHDIIYHDDPLEVAENLSNGVEHPPGFFRPDLRDPSVRQRRLMIMARHGFA